METLHKEMFMLNPKSRTFKTNIMINLNIMVKEPTLNKYYILVFLPDPHDLFIINLLFNIFFTILKG